MANKISLNAAKTELIIFRKPSQMKLPDFKIVLNGKKLYPSHSIKYLGIYLDEFLSGSAHCAQLKTTLQRANGMISKARHYLKGDPTTLLSLYHSIFSSHMLYGCQVWGQTDNKYVKKIQTLQNNAIRLISFAETFRDHVSHLYKHYKLLKLPDLITLKNLLFVHGFFSGKLPKRFEGYFSLTREMHPHVMRNAHHSQVFVPVTDSCRYGRNSIKLKAILAWNSFAQKFPSENLLQYSIPKLKSIIVNHFLENYN